MAPSNSSTDSHYEFFGPTLGPLTLILTLPVTILVICLFARPPTSPLSLDTYFSPSAALVLLAFLALQVILHLALPGEIARGIPPHNLPYKLTGLKNFVITVAVAVYCGFAVPPTSPLYLNLSYLYDNYVQLMASSVVFSTLLSIYLYRRSFHPSAVLAEEGSRTGCVVYEFFLGRELNPRVGSLDLKEFCELYPGLIGWIVLNLGMAHKQVQLSGAVSPSMILVNVFQAIYVLDSLVFERAILTTMDITTDGFGFMLAFGDLAWVPFTYSLQTRWVLDQLGLNGERSDPFAPCNFDTSLLNISFDRSLARSPGCSWRTRPRCLRFSLASSSCSKWWDTPRSGAPTRKKTSSGGIPRTPG